MSTSVLKALSGKLNIKRRPPSILYPSKPRDVNKCSQNLDCILSPKVNSKWLCRLCLISKGGLCRLDIKRHSPSILYILVSLAMSTSALKALPGKLDIKRRSPSILYIFREQVNIMTKKCHNHRWHLEEETLEHRQTHNSKNKMGINATKPVIWVFEKARIKPVSSAKQTI